MSRPRVHHHEAVILREAKELAVTVEFRMPFGFAGPFAEFVASLDDLLARLYPEEPRVVLPHEVTP